MARFNLYFSGAVYPDKDPAQVRQALARMLKLDDQAVNRLFSGRKVLIKRNLPDTELARYENAFKQAGAQVIVEPVAEDDGGLALAPIEPRPEPAAATSQEAESPDPYGTPAAALPAGQVFCRGCGQRIHERAVHCPRCGAPQQTGSERSKVVAGVLAILLGGLGTHRLYLGQWWGVFYLFIPFSSLAALVEGIVFFATPDDRWREKYGSVTQNLVWLIIPLLFVGIAITGILAAVAIPAYQDYKHRAAVSASLNELKPRLAEVDAFVDRAGFFPDANVMVGWDEPLVLADGTEVMITEAGKVELTYTAPASLADDTLQMTPVMQNGAIVDWQCGGGTLPARVRPADCRNDLQQARSAPAPAAEETRQVSPETGDFSVRIPQHWNRLGELEDGPGQTGYGNKFREQYLLVIQEPTVDYHDDADHRVIAEAFLDGTGAYIDGPRYSALETIDVGGYPASAFDLHGRIDGIDISYRGATLRTEQDVYFVLCWTLSDRFDGFRGTCNEVIGSVQPGLNAGR